MALIIASQIYKLNSIEMPQAPLCRGCDTSISKNPARRWSRPITFVMREHLNRCGHSFGVAYSASAQGSRPKSAIRAGLPVVHYGYPREAGSASKSCGGAPGVIGSERRRSGEGDAPRTTRAGVIGLVRGLGVGLLGRMNSFSY